MKRRLGPLALLALLGSACGEPRLLEGFTEGQTRLRLVPSQFIGSVACERGVNGALQTYAALLQELPFNSTSAPDAGFTTVYSTGPVPCDQAVIFPAIAGRQYGAEIYGFDRALTGDVDLSTARWSALCGRGRPSTVFSDAGLDPYRPTVAGRSVTTPLRGCMSFSDATRGAPTQLVVDTASAPGGLKCGDGPGEVFALRGTLQGETRSARCDAPLVFDVPTPNRYYTIELTGLAADGDAGATLGDAGAVPADAAPAPAPGPSAALDASADASADDALDASVGAPSPDASGAPGPGVTPVPDGIPRWRTSCTGRALAGLTVPAVCAALSPLAP